MRAKEVVNEDNRGLKICTVCGALNRVANRTCYNCSWSGEFDVNPLHVGVVVQQAREEWGLPSSPTGQQTQGRLTREDSPLRRFLQAVAQRFAAGEHKDEPVKQERLPNMPNLPNL